MPDEEQVWLGKELERLIKKPDTIVNVTLEGGGHLYPVSNAFLNAVKSWADAKSQKGAYKILDNAKKCADQNTGYKVFDADGKVVYEPKTAEPAVKVPFLVKVSISDLNIRKGPGTDYDRVQFIPIGVYTIMEVQNGKGSSAGWGRLKSGIGWISLDFVRRI